MNAILNIYKDCTSDKPTKTYECKRLLFGVSKKAMTVYDKLQKDDNFDSQINGIVELLKTIFPEFEEDEINYVDASELIKFVYEFINATNAELVKSQKN